MKHYFIYRKGNDSEKLAKSQREQRKIIKHYHCQEECNEVTEIEQADEGVTEEDIRRCYAGDEAQHVVERKEENGYEPNPTDANQNTSTIYYRPLKRWIEVTLEQKRDWERFVGATRKAKQRAGACCIPYKKSYKCDGICDTCEFPIQARLLKYPVPDSVWEEYRLDQEINDRGVGLDMELVRQAIQMDGRSRSELTQAMKELTSLDNPNSVQQMKQWLADNGVETDTLGKKAVAELLKTAPQQLQKVLTLRQQLAKSSVKKYQAMETAVCADGRARGMFQFYGANRTGRWAGRIIQMQNLPQNHLDDLSEARGLVRAGGFDALEMLYEDVPDTLSQLIRTAFVPQEDRKFIVADFSAIEARVIAWLAGEKWRQDVFAQGKDIYCASASQMFGVPVEKHGVNGHLRQKGKIAELALGYGGSVGALKAMGALEMGLQEDELPALVSAWRQANPKIVQFWWAVDHAVMDAVTRKTTTKTHGIIFSARNGMLFITLPSGRSLAYVKPKIGENRFGGDCITYEGVGGTKKWERIDSYGPKFVENIVQATSRDILCYAMQTLRCCSIVMHIHDEVVIEADRRMSLQAVCDQMGRTPPWAKGLQLRADGYETDFYKKD